MRKKMRRSTPEDLIGMYDMHLHILPGIDDGAANMDETVQMLSKLLAQGVCSLCATPHFSLDGPQNKANILRAYTSVLDKMKEEFPQMHLYLGAEIYYSPGILQVVQQGEALTLGGSRYILLEFHPQESFKTVYTELQSFVRSGYIPVIAHVERLSCLWREKARMQELKDMCIPFQMNASSLVGSMDLSVHYCRRLVKEGYIDLLGSDAHDVSLRPPNLSDAGRWILKSCGEEIFRRLAFENPRAVLDDELLYF